MSSNVFSIMSFVEKLLSLLFLIKVPIFTNVVSHTTVLATNLGSSKAFIIPSIPLLLMYMSSRAILRVSSSFVSGLV